MKKKRERIEKDDNPVIGISVSKIISRYGFCDLHSPKEKYNKYITIMARIIDHLIERLNAIVVFIPHVIEPWSNDDRTVAKDILKLVKNKENLDKSFKENRTRDQRTCNNIPKKRLLLINKF